MPRHALIGGASQGIGRAIALALAARGHAVSLLARSEDRLHAVAEEARAAGALEAHVVIADLDDQDGLDAALDRWGAAAGPVQIWVHNTGGPPAGCLIDTDPDAIGASIHRHVVAGHRILRRVLPGMRAAGWGRIVTITSTSVKEPLPSLGVSNLTRAAVHGWVKSLSHELPPSITINDVLPGFTDTPRLRSLAEHVARQQDRDVDTVWADWQAASPARRIGEPAEIAAVVAFLCSEEAGYVTGAAIPVDGGRTRAL